MRMESTKAGYLPFSEIPEEMKIKELHGFIKKEGNMQIFYDNAYESYRSYLEYLKEETESKKGLVEFLNDKIITGNGKVSNENEIIQPKIFEKHYDDTAYIEIAGVDYEKDENNEKKNHFYWNYEIEENDRVRRYDDKTVSEIEGKEKERGKGIPEEILKDMKEYEKKYNEEHKDLLEKANKAVEENYYYYPENREVMDYLEEMNGDVVVYKETDGKIILDAETEYKTKSLNLIAEFETKKIRELDDIKELKLGRRMDGHIYDSECVKDDLKGSLKFSCEYRGKEAYLLRLVNNRNYIFDSNFNLASVKHFFKEYEKHKKNNVKKEEKKEEKKEKSKKR